MTKTNEIEQLFSVPQAAARTDIKPATWRRWILLRKVTSVKIGGRLVRIPASEINRLMEVIPARKEGR
jgi:excisionase family DNA binding protein